MAMKIAAGTRARCTRGAAHAPVTAQPAMEFVLLGHTIDLVTWRRRRRWSLSVDGLLAALLPGRNSRERPLELHTALTTYGSIVAATPLWMHSLMHLHLHCYPHVTPIFTGKTNAVRKCLGRGWYQRRLPGDAFRVGSARASCKYGGDARRRFWCWCWCCAPPESEPRTGRRETQSPPL